MTQNNVKIAVTGGIGSGKSTVCKIIAERNLPVISCDGVYSEMLAGGSLTKKLAEAFGGEILLKNGALDKKRLSEIVFNDKNALEKLNKITHPAVMQEVLMRANKYSLCFCEVPLLFENGFESLFDGVIVVLRDDESRIASVMHRDNLSREKVILRLKSQYNYAVNDLSKYNVIYNGGDLQDLRQKTIEVIEKIKSNTL